MGRTATSVLDAQGRIVLLQLPGLPTERYEYDEHGRVERIRTGEGVDERIWELTYASDGRLSVGTSLGNVSTAVTRNDFGELARTSASFGTSPLYDAGFERDKLGRIARKTETVGGVVATWDYTYDLAGRLEAVDKNGAPYATYTYDSNGNRLSAAEPWRTATATYDEQDRLLTYGDATYTYNGRGQLASRVVGQWTTAYDYDVAGNLRRVDLANGQVVEYLVDPADRRIGKKVDSTLVQGFLYQDLVDPIAELDGAGNVVSRFVYGTLPHVPDYLLKDGETYRYVTDHLGSVRLLVNTATGEVAQRLDYGPFGRVLLDTNPGFQPFGYAGGFYDRNTGLVRFGARDYDPEVGRWTSKDPIGFRAADTSLYEYVYGDPVNFIDPPGLGGCTIDFPGYPITIPGTDTQIPLNHAGVLAYDDQGNTRYYEYGRYPPGDHGRVRRQKVPDLEIGPDGEFAEESWERPKDALREGPGKGHKPYLACRLR